MFTKNARKVSRLGATLLGIGLAFWVTVATSLEPSEYSVTISDSNIKLTGSFLPISSDSNAGFEPGISFGSLQDVGYIDLDGNQSSIEEGRLYWIYPVHTSNPCDALFKFELKDVELTGFYEAAPSGYIPATRTITFSSVFSFNGKPVSHNLKEAGVTLTLENKYCASNLQ